MLVFGCVEGIVAISALRSIRCISVHKSLDIPPHRQHGMNSIYHHPKSKGEETQRKEEDYVVGNACDLDSEGSKP